MCKIDYSLKYNDGRNIVQYAEWCMEVSDSYRAPRILALLKSERDKLYAGIRTALIGSTPLRLNDDSDLTNLVFSYAIDEDQSE